MPRANQDRYNPLDRVPRTMFQHAHIDGASSFPANMLGAVGECFLLMPDNLNGLSALYLWFFGTTTEAKTVNVTVNIATCDEVFNTHTQTVNGMAVNIVANEYECLDLTTTHATVLANLASRDMLWIVVTHVTGDDPFYFIGAELQES